MVNTTISYSQVIYAYFPGNLWLPYGVAILCALICTLASAYFMMKTGATYSHSFSSIVLLTRDKSIDVALEPVLNSRRHHPLPGQMGNIKLAFVSNNQGRSGFKAISDSD
jgi:hypothetical protein